MFNFRNDYHDLCHPKVLQALRATDGENNAGYGFDAHTARAEALIQQAVGGAYPVHFVAGGTAANVLALTFHLRPHQGVVSADSGHIVADEVASIEAMGHKVLTVKTDQGKYDPDVLDDFLSSFGSFHNVLPGIIYLSNATETGLVYTKEELLAIRKVADAHKLLIYVDGARMAAALTAEASDVCLSDYPDFADLFSIGGTKNGALFGEALVFKNASLAEEFIYFQKQRGMLLAKGFTLGSQFEALFTDDLFFENGRIANEAARYLARELRWIGVTFAYPPESNQLFLCLPKAVAEALKAYGQFEVMSKGDPLTVRFVTDYNTTKEEIDEAVARLDGLLKEGASGKSE